MKFMILKFTSRQIPKSNWKHILMYQLIEWKLLKLLSEKLSGISDVMRKAITQNIRNPSTLEIYIVLKTKSLLNKPKILHPSTLRIVLNRILHPHPILVTITAQNS